MRRRLAILALAALVPVAAAYAAPGDPKRKLNAVDNDLARGVLVRQSELPSGSWDAKPTDFSQANPPCVVAHFNLSALTVTGEAGTTYASRNGTNGGISYVESDAHLFLTPAQASRAFAKIAVPGFATCVASALVDSLRQAGYPAALVKAQPIGMHAVRESVAAGFHVVLRIGNRTVDDTHLELLRSRELATVDAFGVGSQPIATSLAAKVASRLTDG
jgi:hypothetical protein